MEPKVEGRWYEISVDGSECDWGKVLVWEPPRRLVLAWSITAQWQYDPTFITELEITFTAEGPKRTHVRLEHRHLERFGEAAEQVRGALDSGWITLLGRFSQAAAA